MKEREDWAQELLRQRAGRADAVVALATVTSTHALGRRIGEEYGGEGTRLPAVDLVAWRQLGGRGRHGRGWSSPPGSGIYVTLLRRLAGLGDLQHLPLAVAVALCETVRVVLGERCRLKWPNDLVAGAGKLGGILIDAIRTAGGGEEGAPGPPAWISFGINYRRDAARGEAGAASVEGEAAGLDPRPALPPMAAFTGELIDAVDRVLRTPLAAAELARRYAGLSRHRPGEELRCRLAGEDVAGVFRGFDEHGFLLLEAAGEVRRLAAGEVIDGG